MSQGGEQLDIVGHICDTNVIEIWTWKIQLPTLDIFGYSLPITKHVVMMWLASIILMAILIPVARRSNSSVRVRNAVEALLIYLRDEVAIAQIGHKGIYFVPFLATLFCFILTCNLLGLVPFCATATGNISVTASLAIISFFVTHISGAIHHGGIHYLKAMVPPVPPALFPLMFVIEVVGYITKPFSLAIRLFANMTAGHIILLVFFSFIFVFKTLFVATASVLGALAVCCLEILVAFIQAFIFTYLTAVFISGAVADEH